MYEYVEPQQNPARAGKAAEGAKNRLYFVFFVVSVFCTSYHSFGLKSTINSSHLSGFGIYLPYMAFKKILSFHPRLAAVLDSIVGVGLVYWVLYVDSFAMVGVWFLARALWWLFLIQSMYYPADVSRWRHFLSLLLFAFGSTALLLFIDAPFSWGVVAVTFVGLPFLSFWLVPKEEAALSFFLKPQRRTSFLMSVFGLAGIWSGVYALVTFQLVGSLTLLFVILGATLIMGAVSFFWWQAYEISFNRTSAMLLGVLTVLVMELAYVLVIWPIGYLLGGLLITWLWYVLWMLFRFRLSAEGITWTKQKPFLITNAALLILFLLFFVRWR